MESAQFDQLWRNWKQSYKKSKRRYGQNTWADIDDHPLDILLMELAELYANASPKQKSIINKDFKRRKSWLWELILFIRRLGKIIFLQPETSLLEIGFGLAEIAILFPDWRDLITSLMIMKIGAEKTGISTSSLFARNIQLASGELKPVLLNVQNHPQESVDGILKIFGPPDWRK